MSLYTKKTLAYMGLKSSKPRLKAAVDQAAMNKTLDLITSLVKDIHKLDAKIEAVSTQFLKAGGRTNTKMPVAQKFGGAKVLLSRVLLDRESGLFTIQETIQQALKDGLFDENEEDDRRLGREGWPGLTKDS